MITLIGENDFGQTPSEAELRGWANEFGINHPVVADDGFAYTYGFIDGGSFGLPSMHIIAPGGEVVERDIWAGESDVTRYLP